ncbi:hypothetical protein [Chryseobacterium sp. LAM-KRS1]|uniref:hypothetical protein n=1 Tax=Chryseobacterium sp. LAM-KRS1 TaxID=2715754 RepID=UPI0015541BD5|nr:hypothetical protein [Chryseobacterium sp. LAM-KRS1]
MDKETARYIIAYFSELMTDHEKLILTYRMYSFMSFSDIQTGDLGELKSDESSEYDHEKIRLNVATRIISEYPEKVFFNNCPKCGKLARTPKAKQCRYCKYRWDYVVTAQFKLDFVLEITNRPFFLIGQIINGEINQSHLIDMTNVGIDKLVKIDSIEFAHYHQNEQISGSIGLATSGLTEEEKQYLKDKSPFRKPVIIISK